MRLLARPLRRRVRETLILGVAAGLVAAAATAQQLRFSPLRGARAEVSALLIRGENVGSIPITVVAVERHGEALALAVSVPRRHLFGEEAGASVVELHVYAFAGGTPSAVAASARRFEAGEGGAEWETLKLTTRCALPAGAERLRLVVFNRPSRTFGYREIALPPVAPGESGPAPSGSEVLAELLRGGAEGWESSGEAELASAPAAGEAAPRPGEALPRSELGGLPARGVRGGGSWRSTLLRREYVAAYREAAEGAREAAAARIVTAESSASSERRPHSVKPLDDVEARLLRRLAAADPRALVPLVRLYQDVVEAHHAAARRVLGERARSRAIRIALAYGEIQGDAEARSESASLLTGLAAAVMRTNGSRAGSSLLQSAIELEPGHPVAALLLGRQLEFVGQLAAAERVLRPAASRSTEVRLRLGVVLARLGRTDEALGILRELAERPEARWENAIATQELARLAAAGGDRARAATLFEQNVKRFPGDASSKVGLAYFLFRTDRRAEARRLAAELPSGGPATQRSRYAEWDEERIAAAEGRLAEAEERHRGALALALAALAEPEERGR